ncbi:MAG TPA: ABC transporter permease subunit, partial [Anaerolineales bacterium]|nr:ABC transporter permease subunit [Anaerolineales bacterium]
PDIIEYEKEEFVVSTPIFTPCPEGGIPESAPVTDPTLPYIIVTPPCADPRTEVTVEGFNFEPNTTGPLNFIPPSGVSLQMGTIVTDAEGHFILTEKLPKRPETVAQEIRAVTRQNVGLPHFNNNAIETWNKIVETIFLALLATTIGVLVAVPASFLAARNIMAPITSPFTSVALSILTLPVGLVAGWWVAKTVGQLGAPVINNLTLNILGLIVAPVIMWVALRWALPPIEEAKPSLGVRSVRSIVLFITALVGILFLYLISRILMVVGTALVEPLGSLRFLADFLSNMGDILGSVVPLVMALVGAGVLGSIAGRIGQWIVEHTPTVANRGVNLLLGAAGGAVLFAMLGGGINWLYEINQPLWTFTIPAILGGIVGAVMGLVLSRNATLPIGFTIYMITRTIFNALRSIESLVMVIIFVVWVGIGPFAGVLALALHTIASNAKLYSEQVEGIMAGPMEALASTGANRLQTIIYAVIPQIIPPYISYTMYRWDINVRMSTIIGFAGGGGIGFLLIQNINLLNYRAASAQMLAIAIVVATMDYLSSWMRERVI